MWNDYNTVQFEINQTCAVKKKMVFQNIAHEDIEGRYYSSCGTLCDLHNKLTIVQPIEQSRAAESNAARNSSKTTILSPI